MSWQIKHINPQELGIDANIGGVYRSLSNAGTGVLSAFNCCASDGTTPALNTASQGSRIQIISIYLYSVSANLITFNAADADVKLIIPVAAGAAIILKERSLIWSGAAGAGLTLTSTATIDSVQLCIRQYFGAA